MKVNFDIRSLLLGGCVVGIVVLLVGAVGRDPQGRYQIAGTQSTCYLVDSTTGQVWSDRERGFSDPKVGSRAKAAAKPYLGQWRDASSDQSQISINLKGDGLLLAKDESGEDQEGRWELVGDRITLSVWGTVLMGQVTSDGRLMVWEDGNSRSRMIFQR
jgi:hypothetical protein